LNANFYIVDDDRTVRKILSKIISDHELGKVIGEAADGTEALGEIAELKPEIVLVDLLLPGLDGITLVERLKAGCPDSCFVMLSQVADKDMVGKAYQAGVDFFINKPINVIEVVSVIGQVYERMNMRSIISSLKTAIGGISLPETRGMIAGQSKEENRRREIKNILAKLGILGESGSEDISDIGLLLLNRPGSPDGAKKMSELYSQIAQKYADQGVQINAPSVEQRVRRAIFKALNNIAHQGLEDYSNEFFVSFSGTFFEFAEVRHQMNYIRGSSKTQGKINAKKFIEGLVMQIQD